MKKEFFLIQEINKLKNMKRYLLIFALLLGAASSWGQTASDQAAIVQKVLDLPGLQQYYPGSQQVYIMQYPYVFPAAMTVTKFGQTVQLADRSVIAGNNANAYFLFQSFNLVGNTANVKFDFYYNYSANKTIMSGTVTMVKNNDTWTVTNTNLIGR